MKKFIIGLLLLSTTALADLTGSTLKVVSVSSNYTATKFDDVVLVDASGGARTVTLPAASLVKGKAITIKKTDSSSNYATLSPSIEGSSQVLITQNDYLQVVSNGANWVIANEKRNWFIDASIASTNSTETSLGTSTVSSFQEMTNSSLALTQNSGSSPTYIACTGANDSSGTTCTGGTTTESNGIAFTAPIMNTYYEACVDFTHSVQVNAGNSNGLVAHFVIVETPNAAQTITLQGANRATAGSGAPGGTFPYWQFPQRLCSKFYWTGTSPTKKTLRLFYRQGATGASDHAVYTSSTTSTADVHWTVKVVR